LAESYILWVIFVLYAVIGVYCLFWIRNDAEFRAGSWAMVAIPAIVLWPIMLPIWLLMRGPEHLTNMAAKQSPRDFQIYMRTKKDKDLFVNFPKQVSAKKPSNNASRTQDSPPSKQSSSGGAGFKDGKKPSRPLRGCVKSPSRQRKTHGSNIMMGAYGGSKRATRRKWINQPEPALR